MRAGLLSNPEVIETINATFVSTWVIVDDVMKKVGTKHPELVTTLLYQHQYPLDFMFLSPEGKLIKRLTSFEDLPGAHAAVGHPKRERQKAHVDVFLSAVAEHFGRGQ